MIVADCTSGRPPVSECASSVPRCPHQLPWRQKILDFLTDCTHWHCQRNWANKQSSSSIRLGFRPDVCSLCTTHGIIFLFENRMSGQMPPFTAILISLSLVFTSAPWIRSRHISVQGLWLNYSSTHEIFPFWMGGRDECGSVLIATRSDEAS